VVQLKSSLLPQKRLINMMAFRQSMSFTLPITTGMLKVLNCSLIGQGRMKAISDSLKC
jgi:hypothetical protein